MMEGKHYAIFSAQYHPHLGGIETFSERVSQALAQRGNSVTIVTNDTNGAGTGISHESGVTIVRLPCIPLVSGRLPLRLPCTEDWNLRRRIAGTRFDGVLINARFYPHSLYGMKLAVRQGLTPVVLDHGSDYLSFSSRILDPIVHLYEDAITSLGKRYRAKYYGVSSKSVEWLTHFGISACGVIPNSIDAEEFRSLSSGRSFRTELQVTSDKLVVAFVGRLIPEKGVRIILEASRSPEIKSRGIVFIIAGSGPLESEVREAQGESLRFVGPLNKGDVSALFQAADLMCLPSQAEGFAIVFLEAASCNCPPIATKVGIAEELIRGDDYGTLLNAASAEELICALLRLNSNRSLIACQAENCRRAIERDYCWERTAKLVESALDNA